MTRKSSGYIDPSTASSKVDFSTLTPYVADEVEDLWVVALKGDKPVKIKVKGNSCCGPIELTTSTDKPQEGIDLEQFELAKAYNHSLSKFIEGFDFDNLNGVLAGAGHTISVSDIWEEIPQFFDDKGAIVNYGTKWLKPNDLVLMNKGYAIYTAPGSFKFNFQAFKDGDKLKNSAGKEVVTYRENKELKLLGNYKGNKIYAIVENIITDDNKIEINQFANIISPTDTIRRRLKKPSNGYALKLYNNGNEIKDFKVDYYSSLVSIPSNYNYEKLTASFFQYVGSQRGVADLASDKLTVTYSDDLAEDLKDGTLTINNDCKSVVSLQIEGNTVIPVVNTDEDGKPTEIVLFTENDLKYYDNSVEKLLKEVYGVSTPSISYTVIL